MSTTKGKPLAIDLGALQDRLTAARRIKKSTASKLQSAYAADQRAGEELAIATGEFDSAFHALRNQ